MTVPWPLMSASVQYKLLASRANASAEIWAVATDVPPPEDDPVAPELPTPPPPDDELPLLEPDAPLLAPPLDEPPLLPLDDAPEPEAPLELEPPEDDAPLPALSPAIFPPQLAATPAITASARTLRNLGSITRMVGLPVTLLQADSLRHLTFNG
ncbi:MAG: hypothetical protein ABSE49_30380 [Polyangiaceae bacterium]|jgi:hypothetical protein